MLFRNRRGRQIGRIVLRRSGVAVTILRAAFQQILLAETARRGIAISYGKRLTGLEDRSDCVVAHFEDGTAAEADVLLAADGVHSRVRALILPGFARPRYTGVVGVGGFAGSDVVHEPHDTGRLNFTVGSQFQFGYATVSSPELQWGWWSHLPQETELTRQELQGSADSAMRARVMQAFRGWHEPIEQLVSTTSSIMRTAIYDVPSLPTWHRGRVMLLGDAAHAMSPAGGQGASLALEDAMIVGTGLAAGRAFDDVYVQAEALLRRRAERIVRQAADNDTRQLRKLGSAGEWMRDRLFPLFVPMIARELDRHYTALAASFPGRAAVGVRTGDFSTA
jgi:2-polyprenyl-6-methoxyphenol hydroxylase-like FAD-dependent oxidoreductase